MATYAYKAMNGSGRVIRGRIEALNLIDLEMRLRRIELELINGREVKKSLFFSAAKIPRREKIHFCFHLEQLLRAGVPLLEALSDLRDSTEHHQFRQMTASLVESIEGGRSFSQALDEHPRVFDPVFCALIQAGESTGKLPEVLLDLSESLKRDDELLAHTQKLLIYPVFVLSMTLAAVSVSMIFVVPELSKLFRSTGQTLPLYTQVLISLSQFMVSYWWLVFGGVVVAVVGLNAYIGLSTKGRQRWDRFKLCVPIFGTAYRKIVLLRFTGLFSMMYASGIPVVDILESSKEVVGNAEVRAALMRVEQLIGEGKNITEAFSSTSIFPPLVTRMLRIGEHTGSLDRALRNVNYFYERDVRESIARAQALLEPLIILILGVLMLWVAISLLGPIYDIITRMKT